MDNEKFDWQHWALWVFLGLVPALAVWRSGYQLWPEAAEQIAGMAICTIGVSLVWHTLVITDNQRLANAGVRALGVLALGAAINWGVHISLSRALSLATHSKVEKNADGDRQHKQQMELAEKEKELTQARTAEAQAKTKLITQIPMNQRGKVNLPAAPLMGPSVAPSGTPSASATPQPQMQTPDEIRAEWLPLVSILAYGELGLSLFCAFAIAYIRYYRDANGNNIPDTAEEEARRLHVDEFQQKYPTWWKHYGQQLYPKTEPSV